MFLDDMRALNDGTLFTSLQDAIRAASAAGMWQVAHELASRYRLQDVLCLSCGVQTDAQNHTYVLRNEQAVRVCIQCFENIRPRL